MIHVLGDSHVSLFTGIHGVCPTWDRYCPHELPGFRVWHLGPFLAYSVGQPRHRVHGVLRERLAAIPRGHPVVCSFGEIDCRNHVVPRGRTARGVDVLAAQIATRYVQRVRSLARGRTLAFLTVAPATVAQHGNTVHPTRGSFAMRARAARAFNAALRSAAPACGAFVVDAERAQTTPGGRPRPALFADGVHADPRALPHMLRAVRALGWLEPDHPAWSAARTLAKQPPPAPVSPQGGGMHDARAAREALIRLAAWRCRAMGARRIAIYGAGRHTRAMAFEAFIGAGLRVACVLDDHAPADVLKGVPVLTPDRCRSGGPGIDAVVISSDSHEEALMERARHAFAGTGLPIIPMLAWDQWVPSEDRTSSKQRRAKGRKP